jgi:hypothetical protein
MERLRELENETLQAFLGASEFDNFCPEGRVITETESDFKQFLSWLEKYTVDFGSRLRTKSNIVKSSDIHVRDRLISVKAFEARTNIYAISSDTFRLDDNQSILNDLRQSDLLCSENMTRYHRISSSYKRYPTIEWEEYAAFVEQWKEVRTRATEALSSAPPSCRNIGIILISLGWFLCNPVGIYMWNQDTLEKLGVTTTTGHMRDSLGRTAAHQWLDAKCFSEDEGDFENIINTRSVDLDIQDFLGRTLLHITCQKRWHCGTAWLLEKRADPGAATGYGSLPLHYAAVNGSKLICKLLLSYQHKFDVYARDGSGSTALDYADRFNCAEIVDLLVDESIKDKSETVVNETTPTDAAARENLHGHSQHPAVATPEHMLDHESNERHQIQVIHQPLLHSDARGESGSTPANGSSRFGGRLTSNDRRVTANASPAALTIEPNECVESVYH